MVELYHCQLTGMVSGVLALNVKPVAPVHTATLLLVVATVDVMASVGGVTVICKTPDAHCPVPKHTGALAGVT